MGVSTSRLTILSLLIPLLIVAGTGTSGAQTTTSNPTTLGFQPSPDHAKVLTDGRPAVSHYEFNVYSVGASAPFQSTDIGKPSPSSDGWIYHDFSGDLPSWPLPGGSYVARVGAVGPYGVGESPVSNSFTFTTTPSCSYSLSGTSASLPAAGGGTQVSVTTGSSCAWTAKSNVSWVVLSTAGGTGNGTVVATVAANGSSAARSGTLTVAGKTFTINQLGAGCTFTLSPSSGSVAAGGGSGSVALTASSTSCAWTAASGATWLSVTPSSGTGGRSLTYSAAANTGAARSGTLTIAGRSFTVSQAGAATTSTPSSPSAPNPAAGATNVTTSPTLSWACSGASSYAVRFGTSTPPAQVSSSTSTSYAPGALVAGRTYYWQVVAQNTSGSTTSPVWSFTTATSAGGSGTPPPAPWVSGDIGSVGLAGSATYASGLFTVAGSGADIWGTADSYHFLYRPLTGLTEIVARLTGQQAPNSLAKAGVMMREGNSGMVAGAGHVTLSVRQDGTVELIRRQALGGTTTVVATTAQAGPVWLKLKRSSSTITASVSTNGTTWRTVGTTSLSLTSKSQFGLAVTAHDKTTRDTASFDNVSVR